MGVCTFFGHRDCPPSTGPQVKRLLEDEISNRGIDRFYVGNRGQFDALVTRVLRELKRDFPHIRYYVVLAYLPGRSSGRDLEDETLFPEGLERVPPRYAINRRNNWMLEQADLVVSYVDRSWGGAAQQVKKARAAGKRVVNLPDVCDPSGEDE